jgi:hypothetical protein
MPEAGRGAKYCSNSHKELGSRQRREATITAIAHATGMSLEDARKLVKSAGMAHGTRWLRQQGMVYIDSLRDWGVPLSEKISINLG